MYYSTSIVENTVSGTGVAAGMILSSLTFIIRLQIMTLAMAVMPLLAQNMTTAQQTSQPKATKAQPKPTRQASVPTESAEHAFARVKYEEATQQLFDVRKQFEEERADFQLLINEVRRLQNDVNKVHINPQTGDISPDDQLALDDNMKKQDSLLQQAKVQSTAMNLLSDKVDELSGLVKRLDFQLNHADECLKVYHQTIDKKISDQTTREAEQIKTCQTADLYPPLTK